MNKQLLNSAGDGLASLLRAARATPALPPRFQDNVWHRIEGAAGRNLPADADGWLDAVVGWVWRPRRAFALTAVLVLAGVGLGWNQGEQLARHEAQARYLAAVAPNSVR